MKTGAFCEPHAECAQTSLVTAALLVERQVLRRSVFVWPSNMPCSALFLRREHFVRFGAPAPLHPGVSPCFNLPPPPAGFRRGTEPFPPTPSAALTCRCSAEPSGARKNAPDPPPRLLLLLLLLQRRRSKARNCQGWAASGARRRGTVLHTRRSLVASEPGAGRARVRAARGCC